MLHNWTVSPGLICCCGAPLRPTPKWLAALPPSPGAPVGFSNEIEREIKPVSRRYGWWITSGACWASEAGGAASAQAKVAAASSGTVNKRSVADIGGLLCG